MFADTSASFQQVTTVQLWQSATDLNNHKEVFSAAPYTSLLLIPLTIQSVNIHFSLATGGYHRVTDQPLSLDVWGLSSDFTATTSNHSQPFRGTLK